MARSAAHITEKKLKARTRKELVFTSSFQEYEPGPELERVKNELRARLRDTGFVARSSLIDSLRGALAASQGTTEEIKERWVSETALALCRGVHVYNQLRLGRIEGDPVYAYRVRFRLRAGGPPADAALPTTGPDKERMDL